MKILVALAFVLLTTKAMSDERQIRRDCTADAIRFCKSAIPNGKAAIIACMAASKPKLSTKCGRHIQ